MTRTVCYVLYYLFARHLPESTKPYAWGARRFRGALARRMLAQAGTRINIEHGADFGSGRRVSLGDRSGIGVDCRLVGDVHIGRDVMMGPEVYVTSVNHAIEAGQRMIDQGGTLSRPVVVEDDVWIGARAVILPGVRIGTGSVVGAGAVVPRDLPPYCVAVGNPARVVRYRSADRGVEAAS